MELVDLMDLVDLVDLHRRARLSAVVPAERTAVRRRGHMSIDLDGKGPE